jgi:predicted DNA-binding protein
MSTERVTVMLSVEQARTVDRNAAVRGASKSAVIREAIEEYLADDLSYRREAVDRLMSMNAPVDDWELMKAQILKSQLGDW